MKNTREKMKSMRRELKSVCYVGEDGGMAVFCKTQRGAWIKFRQQMREDCGDDEAEQLNLEDIKIEYAHLPTAEEIEEWGEDDGFDWFVGPEKKPNSITVWYISP